MIQVLVLGAEHTTSNKNDMVSIFSGLRLVGYTDNKKGNYYSVIFTYEESTGVLEKNMGREIIRGEEVKSLTSIWTEGGLSGGSNT